MTAGPRKRTVPATVSVALCTYNGERFLGEQLASILRQSRLPDQVVVCDDGSSDGTMPMLEQFARRAPFDVDVRRNATNLGSTRNFEQAVRACTGEFIALSDQDDVWHPERLRRSMDELVAHPDAGLVFSDGEVIDDDGRRIGVRLWENFTFEGARKEALRGGNFIPMARRRFVTGATVMFRAKYAPYCFPVGEGWVHDAWIAGVLASMSSVRMIDEPLIFYRRHSAQQIGLGPRRPATTEKTTVEAMARIHWTSFISVRDELSVMCAALDALPIAEEQWERGAAAAFHRHRDFLSMRIALPEARLARVPIMLRQSESYSACAMGWLSIAKDFLLPKSAGLGS